MSGNKKGLLSICCLGYNHGAFIKDNIEAIWSSNYKNIEIIVVDDGSKDNSGEILTELQKKSPLPMTVVLQENTGNIGHNLNVAWKKAKGEFILFMSLDDVIDKDKIQNCVDILNSNQNFAFVAPSKITGIDENGNICNKVSPLNLDKIDEPTLNDLLELEYNEFGSFYIQGVFFRKEVVDAVDGFDEDIIGDDIVLRTKVFRYMKNNSKWSFKIIREPTCYYRRHSNNISSNNKRQIQIVTEYLDKYWSERENPKILIDWMLHTIKHISFKDAMQVFSMNKRAASALNDDRIIKALKKKAKKEESIFRYVYFKEKKGKERIITIFSFIKIAYKTKK